MSARLFFSILPILSEIPCIVIKTEPHEENNVNIISNKTRLNNELIKQRISCIPIHIDDIENFPLDDYVVILNKQNTTNTIMYATSEDFEIQNIKLDKKLSNTKNIILAGELYSLTKERERYGDTISGLGDKSKRKNLRLGVFDIVISDKLLSSFDEKYKFLKKNLGENSKDLSHVLEHKQIKHSDVNKHFKEIVIKNNSEGLIVRNDSVIYKIKKERKENKKENKNK